jgi:integrase
MTLESSAKHYAAAVSALEGASLDDAVGFYMRHHRPAGGVRTVVELLGEYVTAKRKSMRRERTIKDIRSRMGRFAETFGNHHVHMITPADIERWLDDAGYAAQNRLNYLRILSGFFNYARRQGLIEMNPADREHVERPQVDERLPEIFTMGQVEKLLNTAVSDCPKMVPYLSIAFFAGLRSAELDGLGWDSIDLDERLITVRPEVAKKRRQRHVEISNNLAAWLAPYRKMDGRLRPLAARKYLDRIVGAAGVKWVRNGMRHTFASNHLAKHQDMTKTALQLGHVGRLDILFNHYRNLVKPAEAEAYWRIVPPQEVGAVVESTKTV